jgi:hypothetical protein
LPRDPLGFTVNLLTVAEEDQIKCPTEKHWSEPKKTREKVSRLQLKLGNLFGKKSITFARGNMASGRHNKPSLLDYPKLGEPA